MESRIINHLYFNRTDAVGHLSSTYHTRIFILSRFSEVSFICLDTGQVLSFPRTLLEYLFMIFVVILNFRTQLID